MYLKKIYIILFLIINIFHLNANRKIIILNDYTKIKKIKEVNIIKLINKNGFEYFDNLNSKFLSCIDENNIPCINNMILAGAHIKTGIYYAALKNNLNILKKLFKYEKIDFNDETYFLPYKFYENNYKKVSTGIEIFKGKDFLIYKTTYSKLETILKNINSMNYNTLELILENSFNKLSISKDILFNVAGNIDNYRKLKLFIKKFELSWFDKNSNNNVLINIIVKKGSLSLIKSIFEFDIKKSEINFKSNFYDFNILESLLIQKNKYKEKIKFLKSKGAKKSLSKIDYELYYAILFNNTRKVKKLMDNGANIEKLLKLYLMTGKSCKFKKNDKCIIHDKKCKFLDFFLKNNEDFTKIIPYSSCKNNKKYKIFDKISNDDIKQYGNEAVIESIFDNDIINLKYLLKRGIDINFLNRCCDDIFYTVLDLVFKLKNKKMIKILRDSGAKRVCEILNTNCENNKINNFYTIIK